MAKIVTFSRVFPAYHPRKGEETHFVEAILTQLGIDYTDHSYLGWLIKNNQGISELFLDQFQKSLSENIDPKSHTIRNHKRPVKVGDFINPHCWAGKPYNKTSEGYWQIKFAPDIEVKKVWNITIMQGIAYRSFSTISINGLEATNWETLAKNDGLNSIDFVDWFKDNIFSGKIICWNDSITY